MEPKLNPVETTLQRRKRTMIWVKSQIYTDNRAPGIFNIRHFYTVMKTFLFT